jgi:hypothetical protein|tara:strand:- start:396 stop:611 length:216 start_codon:yes stop_codon:yes gene_type:complete
MKFDKDMLMKIALIVFGMIAGIAGYEVVQDDDSVSITLPEAAEEAPTEEADKADAKSEESAPAEAAEDAGE